MENNALQIAMAVIGVLGGAGAWNFYSKRLELKHKETADDKTDQNLFRDQILQELERVKNELGEANKTIVTLTVGFLISTYERDTLHRNGNDEWLTFRMGTCVSDGVFELV